MEGCPQTVWIGMSCANRRRDSDGDVEVQEAPRQLIGALRLHKE